ncbi:hypothetical protein BKA93DRAFT_754543 [Sparassis latifolia]
MGQISFLSACLASVSISAFLYGVFLVLFCTSTYLMAQREGDHAGSSRSLQIWKKPLFIGGIAYFITITADGTAPQEYFSLMVVTNVIKIAFWLSSLAIGDTMLLYRLWMTWSRNVYVIIFPLCTFIASSVLIIWRLWRVHSQVISLVEHSERHGLKASCECDIAWTMLFMASYEAYTPRNNILFLVEDAWAPVSGIAFMLINMRVGLGYAVHTNVQEYFTDRQRVDRISFASLPITSTRRNVNTLENELEVSDGLQLKSFKDGCGSTAGIASPV